jgi:hypothetical protein
LAEPKKLSETTIAHANCGKKRSIELCFITVHRRRARNAFRNVSCTMS